MRDWYDPRVLASLLDGEPPYRRATVWISTRHNRGDEIDAACGQLSADHALASDRALPVAVGAAERVALHRAGFGRDSARGPHDNGKGRGPG